MCNWNIRSRRKEKKEGGREKEREGERKNGEKREEE